MLEKHEVIAGLKFHLDSGSLDWQTIYQELSGIDPWLFNYWSKLFDVGSIINQIDTIPIFQRLYYSRSSTDPVSVLDVGSGTCGGVALFAKIFSVDGPSMLKVRITALELLEENLVKWASYKYPDVNLIFDDVFQHEVTYDLVQSSNVVEHIENPVPFVQRMQKLARDYVLITTPFMELNRIDAHCNTIDMNFINQFNPLEVHVYTNVGWRPHGQVVSFLLRGLG